MRAIVVALFLIAAAPLPAADGILKGQLTDPQGKPVAQGRVRVVSGQVRDASTDAAGRFTFMSLPAGRYQVAGSAPGFVDARQSIYVSEGQDLTVNLQLALLASLSEAITVTADVRIEAIQNPDPAERVLVREEFLDANPGRPGAPVSLPGLPVETASGGIKAPQYFSPGVAGDHGEPIAMFIQVGGFLLPNNLSANAHGNGYADPNILVPGMIESVQTDGGAFNVREGNHSVDLAATYGLRTSLEPYATVTADYRDADLSAGWKWLALQASYGNGFLDTLEHRRQYKINALHSWDRGRHHLTALFLGYYGQSRIPGLVPVRVPGLHDTIDLRQRDQTHTAEIALNDVWRLTPDGELQFSSFFRTYNLGLASNFGDGLIRQSEFRTEAGGNTTYIRKVNRHLTLMTGVDYLREAPRRDDLDRYLADGSFGKVTASNITIDSVTPFAAIDGNIVPCLHYNLGWRRDQIGFDNTDLLTPANSFHRWTGINSPKATLALVPPETVPLPAISFSFGQSFFTNDPRLGIGTQQGSLVSLAHSYQAVIEKTLFGADLRVTLGHVTQEASLAKIDPDTGLQYDEGPSRNRYITASARHYFRAGILQASVSKADARDLSGGNPVPEAPRLIIDVLGTLQRLPFHLQARAEFEDVGRTPLGDGFSAVPVRELRGALLRSFQGGRIQVGLHFQIAAGYTGQTTETLALSGESDPFERVVGVYIPSYATASFSYRITRRKSPSDSSPVVR
jgi:hypothetical protein